MRDVAMSPCSLSSNLISEKDFSLNSPLLYSRTGQKKIIPTRHFEMQEKCIEKWLAPENHIYTFSSGTYWQSQCKEELLKIDR